MPGQVGIGGLDFAGTRQLAARMVDHDVEWALSRANRSSMHLDGAKLTDIPAYTDGKVPAVPCHVRESGRMFLQALELMLVEGRVKGKFDAKRASP